ncbi:hypothetical protein ABEV55_02975 [Aneurinibacillus thermoaerophilus]|uniref:hypothetical protein n=1 Tax=Aneurinibacillus thermoaerophilus TaxID=143495 RepID=UPI002E20110C|nr:hypothetical protein [Aneurinibacillus thermoaerophilus]
MYHQKKLFCTYRTLIHKDGKSFWVWVTIRAVPNGKEHHVRQYGVHLINKPCGEERPVGDAIERQCLMG